MSRGLVLRETQSSVGILTLNRPRRLNAFTPALQQELYDGLEAMEADPAVRVIVVTGAGKGFCGE